MYLILMILGIALWAGAHLFKRMAPDARANMGDKGKGSIALALLAIVAALVAGLYPSMRAAGSRPALAMREE